MPVAGAGRWTVSPGHQLTGNEAGVGPALDSGAAVGPPTALPSFVTVGKVSFLPAVRWFSFLKSGNALQGPVVCALSWGGSHVGREVWPGGGPAPGCGLIQSSHELALFLGAFPLSPVLQVRPPHL